MFYCDPCRSKNGWPQSLGWPFMVSRGRCEVCHEHAECHDAPSSHLPNNSSKEDDMHIERNPEKPFTSTVALVKPDALAAGHLGEILSMAEDKLVIADLVIGRWSRSAAGSFYAEHRQQEFFPELITFMTSGRLAFCTLVGPDAVETWREMMGSTNSAKAAEGTIRALFGNKDGQIMVNCVHGSDSAASALREAKIIRDHVAMGFGHEAMRIVSESSGV